MKSCLEHLSPEEILDKGESGRDCRRSPRQSRGGTLRAGLPARGAGADGGSTGWRWPLGFPVVECMVGTGPRDAA